MASLVLLDHVQPGEFYFGDAFQFCFGNDVTPLPVAIDEAYTNVRPHVSHIPQHYEHRPEAHACGHKDQRRLRRLMRSIISWFGDVVEADDVLQTAYLRALERGKSLRDEKRVFAWFTPLVRSVPVDRSRAKGTQDRIRENWSNEAFEQIDPLEDLEAEV